jgi:hypothetical protein
MWNCWPSQRKWDADFVPRFAYRAGEAIPAEINVLSSAHQLCTFACTNFVATRTWSGTGQAEPGLQIGCYAGSPPSRNDTAIQKHIPKKTNGLMRSMRRRLTVRLEDWQVSQRLIYELLGFMHSLCCISLNLGIGYVLALENPLALMQSSSLLNFARTLKFTPGPTFFRQEKLPHGMVRILHRRAAGSPGWYSRSPPRSRRRS